MGAPVRCTHLHIENLRVHTLLVRFLLQCLKGVGFCRCPECSYGDIDLNLDGNGRWSVEWYAVPCNVGNGTLHYKIIGQNPYWFMFIISNTRCLLVHPHNSPLLSLESHLVELPA